MHWLAGLDYHHWLLLGLTLLVLEMLVGRGSFLWLGLAALFTGVLTLLLPFVDTHLSWTGQLVLFSALVAALLLGWLLYREVDE